MLPVAAVGDDVGEVVGAAGLELGARCERGLVDVAPGGLEVTGRGLDPREQQRRRAVPPGRRGVAGGFERGEQPLRPAVVAEDDPRPAEPVGDRERPLRVVLRAPRERGVDVRALGADELEVLGLARAAHPRRGFPGRRREPRRVRVEAAPPRVAHLLEREGADAVEQPEAVAVDDHE